MTNWHPNKWIIVKIVFNLDWSAAKKGLDKHKPAKQKKKQDIHVPQQ